MAEGAPQLSKEAVTLCITMLGTMSLWTGVLETGHRPDPVDQLTGRMFPLLIFLFPRLSPQGEARKQVAVNMVANILGLGWATTPAGIKTIEGLKRVEENRGEYGGGTASNEMCTFLIINTSSLQLIPMNTIACRSQYGGVNPTAVVGPVLVAAFSSIVVAAIFCKVIDREHSP